MDGHESKVNGRLSNLGQLTVQFLSFELPIFKLNLKIEFSPRSGKVEENRMEQCNMDLKSIEVFLSVLKYQVLLEYLVIYSSYKTAYSLVHRIANYIRPKIIILHFYWM